MRRKLDPEKTRSTISDVAFRVFAQKGYSGTSIADIAKEAGVPKSLVQYHFGSKEQLWQDCLIQRAGPMLAAIERVLGGETADLMELARARIQVHQAHPEISRFFAWASLETVPLPEFIQEKARKVREKYLQDPERFEHLLVAFATIDGWFLHKPLYQRLLQMELDPSVNERVAECVEQWMASK